MTRNSCSNKIHTDCLKVKLIHRGDLAPPPAPQPLFYVPANSSVKQKTKTKINTQTQYAGLWSGQKEKDVAKTIIRKVSPGALEDCKRIRVVLQYILLNSEPTVSFLLLKSKGKKKNKTTTK